MAGKAYSSGCKTCIKRKVKCDELKPKCDVCRKSGRVCGGFRDKFRVYSTSAHHNGVLLPLSKETYRGRIEESSPSPTTDVLLYDTNKILLEYFEKNINGRGYTQLLSAVRYMNTTSSAVTSTFGALCAATFGKLQNDGSMKSLGFELYQDSLVRVQLSINDKDNSMADETLLCILMLSQVEITMVTEESAWRSHILGAAELIRHRGSSHAKYSSPELYDNFRLRVIFEALTAGRRTYLSEEEWHCQSQNPLSKLINIASMIPELLARRIENLANDFIIRDDLYGEAVQVNEDLLEWRKSTDI